MSKRISMSLEDYNKDLNLAATKGQSALMAVVRDLMVNKGANIKIDEKADPVLVAFIDEVKKALGQ